MKEKYTIHLNDGRELNQSNMLLSSRSGLIEGDFLWLLSNYTCSLIKIDLSHQKMEKWFPIPAEKNREFSFYTMAQDEEKIYVSPHSENDIWVFDKKLEQFEKIDLHLTNAEKKKEAKFRISYLFNGKLYLIGCEISDIFCVDTKTGKVNRVPKFKDKLKEAGIYKDSFVMNYSYAVKENRMMIPFYDELAILELDLDNQNITIYMINHPDIKVKGISTIRIKADNYVLTDFEDHIIEWNPNFGIANIEKLNVLTSNNREETRYIGTFAKGDKQYLFPACEGKIVYKENEKQEYLSFEYPNDIRLQNEYYAKWELFLQHGDELIFQPGTTGMLYELNMNTSKIREISISIDASFREEIVKHQIENNIFVIQENGVLSLEDILCFLCYKNKGFVKDEKIGKKIYEGMVNIL